MATWKQANAVSRAQLMAMFGETPESLLPAGLSHEEFEGAFKKANSNFPLDELKKSWVTYHTLQES